LKWCCTRTERLAISAAAFIYFLFNGDLRNRLRFNNHVRWVIVNLTHLRYEPVATSGNGNEKAWLRGLLAERAPHCGNIDGEVRFFQLLSRPDAVQNFILVQVSPATLDQQQKQIERLRIKRYDFAFAQ
jgi:hypothetical protein